MSTKSFSFHDSVRTGSVPDLSSNTLVTTIAYAFYGCTGLTGSVPDLSSNTLVTTMQSAFQNCSGITGNTPSFTAHTVLTRADWPGMDLDAWTTCTISATFTNASWNASDWPVGSVNQCLVDFDTAGSNNGSLNLAGAGMAAPTVGPPDGVAAKANLVARGWVVTTN